MAEKVINTGGRFHDTSINHTVTGANEVLDDDIQKKQSVINAEQQELNQEQEVINADTYRKNEVYNKEETNNIISRTPETDVIVVNVPEGTDIATYLEANIPNTQVPETHAVKTQLAETKEFGKFIGADGQLRTNPSMDYYKYSVSPTDRVSVKGFGVPDAEYTGIAFVHYYHDDEWLGYDENYLIAAGPYYADESFVTLPSTCNILVLNTARIYHPIAYVNTTETVPGSYVSSRANKLYRVPGPDNTTYSEWAWDGTTWVMLANKDYGVDDRPIKDSTNLISSKGVYPVYETGLNNTIAISDESQLLTPTVIDNSFMLDNGTVVSNRPNFKYYRYSVQAGKLYTFSSVFDANTQLHFLIWLNSSSEAIGHEPEGGDDSVPVTISNQPVFAPKNAAYACINVGKTVTGEVSMKRVGDVINSKDLKEGLNYASVNTFAHDNYPNISQTNILIPTNTETGHYIKNDGTVGDNQYFLYQRFNVVGENLYSFSGSLDNSEIYYVHWYDAQNNYLGHVPYIGKAHEVTTYTDQVIASPRNAAYALLNVNTSVQGNVYNFKHIVSLMNVSDIRKNVIPFISEKEIMNYSSRERGKCFSDDGERENQYLLYDKYLVQPNHVYLFSAAFGENTGIPFVYWLDSQENVIAKEPYEGSVDEPVIMDNQPVIAPPNAAYLILNSATTLTSVVNVGDVYDIDNILHKIGELSANVSAKTVILPDKTDVNMYFTSDGFVEYNGILCREFNITAGDAYLFSARLSAMWSVPLLFWTDDEYNTILQEPYKGSDSESVTYTDTYIKAPTGATRMLINADYANAANISVKHIGDVYDVDNIAYEIDNLKVNISTTNVIDPDDIHSDMYFGANGFVEFNGISCKEYDITAGDNYLFSTRLSIHWSVPALFWVDDDYHVVLQDIYNGSDTETVTFADVLVKAPAGATKMLINVDNPNLSYAKATNVGNVIKSQTLQDEIDEIRRSGGKYGLMKVVVKMLDRPVSSVIFNNHDEETVYYIRTKYNDTKDIILSHYINGNQLLSFKDTYIGDKRLDDDTLMTSDYLVSHHIDSTAPLLHADTYWHIFGQHGCPMPTFTNNSYMTSDDVGAEWKDQLNRHYHVGYVTNSNIYLVPVMYIDSDGHWTRDWKSRLSDAITSLTHVSGGVYTDDIQSISGYGDVQLRPVMNYKERRWFADDVEIVAPGTYYCNDFNVSESAIGYDPATITNWFGGPGHNVDLTGAQVMAEFTFSYNYKGAQCCVNTTVSILREVECQSYSPIQQEFFFDKGDYKAMFMIPKAHERGGVEIDKPFYSPSAASTSYVIYRSDGTLKDINDPVDRQIGFLQNPNTGDYLVGMAAGLSLVSGDTIKSKRNQNCPVGWSNAHYRLLNFSPSNINKFYIAAINTAPFENDDYYLPNTYFKELNYYVSYFDPAENDGQVYWYKDGSSYVIYAHCQSAHNRKAVNVSCILDGLKLSVVEKTDGVELLTDIIQNGKFFVNYTNATNYIVLKAE